MKDFNSIRLEDHNIHDITAILRIYFQELPEPVIPFDYYETLMEVQRNADLPIEERIARIKDVIDNIPQANSTLLKYIIEYLQKIEEHSTVNKMTVR